MRNDSQYGRSYEPRGKTPSMIIPAKRERINLISAVTNQGKIRFMAYESSMNADMLIKFLKRLIKDAGRKVFLIPGNLRVHHGKVVKEWIESHQDEIELFFLPSYSPELNPDEYLNLPPERRCSFGCAGQDLFTVENQGNIAFAYAPEMSGES
ncbi:MAG: transposase [Chloroflexota bacterium]|nr:transposase [Chloroflexota bacterium]